MIRYYKRVDKKGKTTTVESYSHNLDVDDAIEIDEEEFRAFVASLPMAKLQLPRDLASEIDELKADVKKLKEKY